MPLISSYKNFRKKRNRSWPSSSTLNWFLGKFGVIATIVFVSIIAVFLELILKGHVLFSETLFLDDIFYFERAIHDRPFNDMWRLIPTFEGVNFDQTPNLIIYRWLAVITSDIVGLRMIHVVLFGMCCGLWSGLLLRITNNFIFSALTGLFSFFTPYAVVMNIFANGSYALFFLFLYFTSFHFLLSMRNAASARSKYAFLVIATLTCCIAVWIVPSGILLAFVMFLYFSLVAKEKSLSKENWPLLSAIVVVVSWGIFCLSGIEHPYSQIDGRLTFKPMEVIENGAALTAKLVRSYFIPPLYGSATKPILWLWFSAAIAIAFSLCALTCVRLLIGRSRTQINVITSFFVFFLAGAFATSLAPYTAQNYTHLWHNFPHLIFAITSLAYILYVFVDRRASYVLFFILAICTVLNFPKQIHAFEVCQAKQEALRSFISDLASVAGPEEKITLMGFKACRASGLSSSFRSTSFRRYVTGNPDAEEFFIRAATSVDAATLAQDTLIFMVDGKAIKKLNMTGEQ